MRHILITIEGGPDNYAPEVARLLSERLECPAYPVEVLQAAAVSEQPPQALHHRLDQTGRHNFLSALFLLSARQGTLRRALSLRKMEHKIAAGLLRHGTYILSGEMLHAFCSVGLPKYEAYIHTGKARVEEGPVQFPKDRSHGKGYDITLDSARLNPVQCTEWIFQSLCERAPVSGYLSPQEMR